MYSSRTNAKKRLLTAALSVVLLLGSLAVVPAHAAGLPAADVSPFNSIIYDPGGNIFNIQLTKYENTGDMFWTKNMDGEVSWFSSDPEVVEVTGYTQNSCGVAYRKAGEAILTMSHTYIYLDYQIATWLTGNTQVRMHITVEPALPPNNTEHFAGGSGTEQDPYLISTKQHLANINMDPRYLTAHFKLTNDILFEDADFEEGGEFYTYGYGWYPIASPFFFATYDASDAFTGVFDGNGFIISGLYSAYSNSGDLSKAAVGLFGVNLGTIKNLGVENSEIQAFSQDRSIGYAVAGGIAGANAGIIENCYVKSSYLAGDVVGGITGENFGSYEARITDCYSGNNRFTSTPALQGFQIYGGIVGNLDLGSVSRTYSFHYISVFEYGGNQYYPTAVGGVVGNLGSGTVSDSYYCTIPIPRGIYSHPDNTQDTTGLEIGQMMNLANFPALSPGTWYVNSDDFYGMPQLTSFNRIKQVLFVSSLPYKCEYSLGDSLDLSGTRLTAVAPDGSLSEINIDEKNIVYSAPGDSPAIDTVYVDGFDSETTGTKVLRIVYNDMNANCQVYVVDGNSPDPILGDVNGDGIVDMSDLIYLSRHVAGWVSYPLDAEALENADLNSDGKVDMRDTAYLAQLVKEIEHGEN